jgi:hypothetical protein
MMVEVTNYGAIADYAARERGGRAAAREGAAVVVIDSVPGEHHDSGPPQKGRPGDTPSLHPSQEAAGYKGVD